MPLVALLLAVALSLTVTLELWNPYTAIAPAVFGYLAGRRSVLARPGLLTFAAMAVVCLLLTLVAGRGLWTWLSQLATLAFAVGVPWLVGRYVRVHPTRRHRLAAGRPIGAGAARGGRPGAAGRAVSDRR
ncbi:hypothetical protein AB0M87_01330 [Streptomyces sp. NPDC051320]|uniref:hypothetical protein n=1 Tax=Streptomyces sp. NPDC051320 TaxID=3154644 RepID=UPI003423143F